LSCYSLGIVRYRG